MSNVRRRRTGSSYGGEHPSIVGRSAPYKAIVAYRPALLVGSRINLLGYDEPNGHEWRTNMVPKNTICLWYNGTALDAANFYAETFPDSAVRAVHRAPGDYPAGKQGDVL